MSEIQRLLRKELRHKVIQKKPIFLLDTRFAKLTLTLLSEILPHGPKVEIIPKLAGVENEFFPTSQEEYLSGQLAMFLENKRQTNTTPLMETIPENLLIDFAKKMGIELKKTTNDALNLIEQLQSIQSQTKPSLQKSFENLRTTSKKNTQTKKN